MKTILLVICTFFAIIVTPDAQTLTSAVANQISVTKDRIAQDNAQITELQQRINALNSDMKNANTELSTYNSLIEKAQDADNSGIQENLDVQGTIRL